MRKFCCLVLVLAASVSVFAQRKYNKREHKTLQIYMVNIPGGKFDMGDDTSMVDRRPAHTVRLGNFALSAYEVTQRQWRAVMDNNPSSYECDDCPVNNVSYDDALEFISRLNHAMGTKYRLPTEAEWEYAARGGQLERIHNVDDPHFSGKQLSGRQLPQTVAWFQRNSDDHIHRVGVKQPNELGLYDMSGNVEEWCADFYSESYYTNKPVANPKGPDAGLSHVVRGGSYFSDPSELSVTRRAAFLPNTRSVTLGFRLAADLPKAKVHRPDEDK
jgi:formylglycine-generating enzyme required for sulfatase activity